MPEIKLTPKALDILKRLRTGKLLADSKDRKEAYIVFADYSFCVSVSHRYFDELKDKGFIKKVDTRIASVFYLPSAKGSALLKSLNPSLGTED